MKQVQTQVGQIDQRRAAFEQRLHAQGLLDDIVMRSEHRQGSLQALEFLVDGVAAGCAEGGSGICRQHMLDKTALRVAQVIGRLAECKTSAPGAENMASFSRRFKGCSLYFSSCRCCSSAVNNGMPTTSTRRT